MSNSKAGLVKFAVAFALLSSIGACAVAGVMILGAYRFSRPSNASPTSIITPTVRPTPKNSSSVALDVHPVSFAQTLEPDATPTIASTSTPQLTATPEVESSAAGLLSLEDLPPGFEPYSLADLGMSEADLQRALSIESSFAFRNAAAGEFQIIIGLTTSLPARLNWMNSKSFLSTQLNAVLDSITRGYSRMPSAQIDELPVPQVIGEIATGKTIRLAQDKPAGDANATRTDIVVFQRGRATAILFVVYLDGVTPPVTTLEIAERLDRRLNGEGMLAPSTSTPAGSRQQD